MTKANGQKPESEKKTVKNHASDKLDANKSTENSPDSSNSSSVGDVDVSKSKKSNFYTSIKSAPDETPSQKSGGSYTSGADSDDDSNDEKRTSGHINDDFGCCGDAECSCVADDTNDCVNTNSSDELAAEKDKYLRLLAEYDNFRKRSAKEKSAAYSEARATAITAMLPVYDNLERALKMHCDDEAFYKGVEMTMTGLCEIFENLGVTVIESLGKPFDPNLHNAVMSVEDPEFGEKVVSEEFQKGFMLGDRVIRFSTVVVAN